ncbi:MAG: hypothetical protein V3S98_10645 [Dehalococcoidia bacterium]
MDGILVDVWSPEYVGRDESPALAAGLIQALRRSLAELDEEYPSLVASYLRCMTVNVERNSWIAGLARVVGHPQGLTPTTLLELMHRDRIERLLHIFRIDEHTNQRAVLVMPPNLRRLLVEVGAKVSTCWQLGIEVHPQDMTRWETLLLQLQAISGSQHLMRQLAEHADGKVAKGGVRPLTLALEQILRDAGIEIATQPSTVFQLYKTRRQKGVEVDWSTIDGLSRLSADRLENLYDFSSARAHLSESAAYCAAMSDYLTGRFGASVDFLRLCLEFDEDVEEYWLLLAFALRYLGHKDRFAQIVFDGLREMSCLSDQSM